MDKIICVGKNYLDHVLEMGDKTSVNPVIFLKPPSVLRQAAKWGETLKLELPKTTSTVDHECEIVFRINRDIYQINAVQAATAIDAVTIGLDMTLRSLQDTLKKEGSPWTTAKVFKDAAVIGPWLSMAEFSVIQTQNFNFSVDNTLRQQGNLQQMRLSFVEQLVYISEFFPLCAGDIIFTGTPAGVGAISKGAIGTLKWSDYQYAVQW